MCEHSRAHVAIKETTRRTLPIAIALFQSQHLTAWGQVFAASIVALLPVVLAFSTFQRHFIRGIYPENSARFARGEAFSGISGALSGMKDRLEFRLPASPGPAWS